MKNNGYQQFLDNYLAEVAAAAVQFEGVLKEQTKALQKLVDEQRGTRDEESQQASSRGDEQCPNFRGDNLIGDKLSGGHNNSDKAIMEFQTGVAEFSDQALSGSSELWQDSPSSPGAGSITPRDGAHVAQNRGGAPSIFD